VSCGRYALLRSSYCLLASKIDSKEPLVQNFGPIDSQPNKPSPPPPRPAHEPLDFDFNRKVVIRGALDKWEREGTSDNIALSD
jgi:hypothetical protein